MIHTFELASCLLSLGFIVFIWHRLFGSLGRDNFRSNIRKLRDELFDFVWKNNLDYNTPAYQETRQLLNGLIRSAEVLTPTNILAHLICAFRYRRKKEDREETVFAKSMKELRDPAFIEAIKKAREEASREMIHFIFLQGFVGVIMRLIFFSFGFFFRANSAWQIAMDQTSKLAYKMGGAGLGPLCHSK